MTLVRGSCLGPYEIQSSLGAGGMGEVYRARDPRLHRDVAIKVLAHAGDAQRQRRLLDEAQAASALNHPNIVAVYDVGNADGVAYIVSELVGGSSLRLLLGRAPLPVREVLDLAVQMADGLAAAHQAGIVHRDFKPENVMVAGDGRVKILDFGLAQVSDGTAGPDAARTMTLSSGMIVGTVPYMSPEQARGAVVDYRTDQFSLGLTLYEMVTGRRAFTADSAAQILAAIIEDDAEPIGAINSKVPAPLRWVIERCLAKDARQRYESTTDLARELRTLRDRLTEFAATPDSSVPPARRRWTVPVLAAAVILATLGMIAGVAGGGAAGASLDRYRFSPFATDAGYQSSPAWSPDGKTLAYVAAVDGVLQVFTKAIGSPQRVQVTHSRFDCSEPFWSPDGTRLYYVSLARDRAGLWSISASGGDPEFVMADVGSATMSPDGKTLAFFRGETGSGGWWTLWLSSPPGSEPRKYDRPPFGASRFGEAATVRFSPDGSRLGAWVIIPPSRDGSYGTLAQFWVLPVGEGTPHQAPLPTPDLPDVAAAFSWLPDSRRILSALPHPRPGMHLWLTDTERPDPHLLLTSTGRENDPAVSPDGTRVALSVQQADYDLYQFSVDGASPSVVFETSRNEMDPAWSSAGSVLAFTTDRTGREEIWLRSQPGNFERPLVTPDNFSSDRTKLLSTPALSPDSQRVAFHRIGSDGNLIWIAPVAGGPPIRLTSDRAVEIDPSWSPDGQSVVFVRTDQREERTAHAWSVAKMRVGARTPPVVLAADALPSTVQWSPDGALIAYNSQDGLAVISPDGQAKRLMHEHVWLAFTWSEDSRRLYGLRPSDDFKHLTFTSVDIRTGAERVLGPDVLPVPVAAEPVRGFTRVSPTTFLTSIVNVRSDIWLLDGFELRPQTLGDRLRSAIGLSAR